MALPVYSSKDVRVTWCGVALPGLAEDTFVKFSYNSDVSNEKVGADGSVEISLTPDKTGTCTITLLQQSDGNFYLGAALAGYKNGVFYQGAITVTDPSGSVLALLRGCHIKTAPEIVMAKETEAREWTFFVEQIEFISLPKKYKDLGAKISDTKADQIAGAIDTLTKFIL